MKIALYRFPSVLLTKVRHANLFLGLLALLLPFCGLGQETKLRSAKCEACGCITYSFKDMERLKNPVHETTPVNGIFIAESISLLKILRKSKADDEHLQRAIAKLEGLLDHQIWHGGHRFDLLQTDSAKGQLGKVLWYAAQYRMKHPYKRKFAEYDDFKCWPSKSEADFIDKTLLKFRDYGKSRRKTK